MSTRTTVIAVCLLIVLATLVGVALIPDGLPELFRQGSVGSGQGRGHRVVSVSSPQPTLDFGCNFRVRVTEAATASPWALGLRLLVALRSQPGFAWIREGQGLDTLTGTKAVRAAIERGDPVDAILAAEAAGIARWRRERHASLLYNRSQT